MRRDLNDDELETYSRQIVLSDIGYEGQLRLRQAKVCLIGVGGLGSPVALELVAMGVGYLRLVDPDIVSKSDLHRQLLYDTDSIGLPKVEAACQKLIHLNPRVKLDCQPEALNSMNAENLISGMDVVIDGLDRPEPRYIINRTCNHLKIPYVFGSAIETFGNVSTIIPGQTFCLECFMSGLKDEDLPTCGVVGVHPSILGIISSVQVSEAVRLITENPPKLFNKLFYADLREFEFVLLEINPSDSCKVCGRKSEGPPEKITDKFFLETCARDRHRTFILSPRKRLNIDLVELKKVIKRHEWTIKAESQLSLTFKKSKLITVCVLKSGIMIANTPSKVSFDSKSEVLEIYRSILVDSLGMPECILPEKH